MSEQPGPRWYTLDEMCERLGLDPDVIRARADEHLEGAEQRIFEDGLVAGIEAAIHTVERTAGLDLMVMDSSAWVSKAAILRALRKMLPGGS